MKHPVDAHVGKRVRHRRWMMGMTQQQLGDIFAVLSGMLLTAKGKKGQDLIQGRQVSENPELFATIFEVGRRYKVMNPNKGDVCHSFYNCTTGVRGARARMGGRIHKR